MVSGQINDIITATLQAGLDDWVSIGSVESIALYYGAPSISAPGGGQMVPEEFVIPVITHLSENKLVRIGDVYTQGEFVPYDGTEQEALAWMIQIYRAHERMWHWLAWMELTPEGKALAESLPTARYHIRENEDDA